MSCNQISVYSYLPLQIEVKSRSSQNSINALSKICVTTIGVTLDFVTHRDNL